jgi:hypothetical protein
MYKEISKFVVHDGKEFDEKDEAEKYIISEFQEYLDRKIRSNMKNNPSIQINFVLEVIPLLCDSILDMKQIQNKLYSLLDF